MQHVEIAFNVGYLILVWWIVLVMYLRRRVPAPENRRAAMLLLAAFFLLGLGDLGHVGFRVAGFALGGLSRTVPIAGVQVNPAALGSLATAITFTFFYVLLVMLWQARFQKAWGWAARLVLVLAVVRLLIMAHPANSWNALHAPPAWSIARNVPLMLIQLVVAGMILRDALARHDRTYCWIAVMILVSFVCYAPVIFFQRQVPQLGMLMMPKTIAYLVIAVLGYRCHFRTDV